MVPHPKGYRTCSAPELSSRGLTCVTVIAARHPGLGGARKERDVEIELGKPVVSSDGKHVGDVDGLVLDIEREDLQQLVVRKETVLNEERAVHRRSVARVDQDGAVHLTINSEMFERLPRFVEETFILPRETDELRYPPHEWTSGYGQYPVLLWGPTSILVRHQPGVRPVSPPGATKMPTTLPLGEVEINGQTEVIGSDGESLGTVDEIISDASGNITGLVIKEGILVQHRIRVPVEWIASIWSNQVELSLTAAEVKQRAGPVERDT